MPRRIVQIAIGAVPEFPDFIYALCNDGTLWEGHSPPGHSHKGVQWTLQPDIPQDGYVEPAPDPADYHVLDNAEIRIGDMAACADLYGIVTDRDGEGNLIVKHAYDEDGKPRGEAKFGRKFAKRMSAR